MWWGRVKRDSFNVHKTNCTANNVWITYTTPKESDVPQNSCSYFSIIFSSYTEKIFFFSKGNAPESSRALPTKRFWSCKRPYQLSWFSCSTIILAHCFWFLLNEFHHLWFVNIFKYDSVWYASAFFISVNLGVCLSPIHFPIVFFFLLYTFSLHFIFFFSFQFLIILYKIWFKLHRNRSGTLFDLS